MLSLNTMCELNSGCVQLSSALKFDRGLNDPELCDGVKSGNTDWSGCSQFDTVCFELRSFV